MNIANQQAHVVWRFVDGKPGHENQTAGLIDALWREVPIELHNVTASRWLCGNRTLRTLPPPSLLVGAGTRTHAPMLRACARFGGRSVVLMQPQGRQSQFDLCLIPAHDRPKAADNVLITNGAINKVRPYLTKTAKAGLILAGGPSRHYDWLDRELVSQVCAIIASDPQRRWTLCDSRRTPLRTRSLLQSALPEIEYAHYADVPEGWLADALSRCPVAWVSEDSVSMVYEALTGGASVGILAVPRRRRSRVADGVTNLVTHGMVTPFLIWQNSGQLPSPNTPLAEAQRCGKWIAERWLNAT